MTGRVWWPAVQRHVDQIQDGYAGAFGDALQRAIDAQSDYTISECASGSGLSAMMRRSSAGTCEGEDLNAALAAALDSDAALKSSLSGLTGGAWPQIGLEGQTQPAVAITGTGRDVNVAALADALIGDLLDVRLENFEDSLAPLEEAIDAGDEAAIAQAAQLKEAYRAQLAEDGAALLSAVTDAIERAGKKNDVDGISLCANPAGLGGCGGTEASNEVYQLIEADKKLQKAIGKMGS